VNESEYNIRKLKAEQEQARLDKIFEGNDDLRRKLALNEVRSQQAGKALAFYALALVLFALTVVIIWWAQELAVL
jgi:hypothetical protein